jgi:hypothetical protein
MSTHKILDNDMIGHMATFLMNLHNKLYTGTPVDGDDMTMLSGIIGVLNFNHKN